MTRMDNLVELAVFRLAASLSDSYDQLLRGTVSEMFHVELTKLDVGLTERFARRPITNQELSTVTKQASRQFREMCLRERQREEPTGTPTAKGRA